MGIKIKRKKYIFIKKDNVGRKRFGSEYICPFSFGYAVLLNRFLAVKKTLQKA